MPRNAFASLACLLLLGCPGDDGSPSDTDNGSSTSGGPTTDGNTTGGPVTGPPPTSSTTDPDTGSDGPTSTGDTTGSTSSTGTTGSACDAPVKRYFVNGDTTDLRTLLTDNTELAEWDSAVSVGASPQKISGDGDFVVFQEQDNDGLGQLWRQSSDGTGDATLISEYTVTIGVTPIDDMVVTDQGPVVDADATEVHWTSGEDDWGVVFRRSGGVVEVVSDVDLYFPLRLAGNDSGVIVVAYDDCLGGFGDAFTCAPRSTARVGILANPIGTITELVALDGGVGTIAVSPDGTLAAYIDFADSSEVFSVPTAGGAAVSLSNTAAAGERFLRVRASDDRVAYVHDDNGAWTVESVAGDGSGDLITHLTSTGALNIDLSTDGETLIVQEDTRMPFMEQNVYVSPLEDCEMELVLGDEPNFGIADIQ